MTHRPFLAAALLVLAASSIGCAGTASSVDPDVFAADVAWLADDAREGRETGSPGLQETARWIARRFADAGLVPAGADGTYMQRFTAAGARKLGDGNQLSLAGLALDFESEWIPLASSASASVRGPLVFAGFGISDTEGRYDDYAGLDVRGAVVLVLRGGPGQGRVEELRAAGQAVDGTPRWSESGEGREHITFSKKINAAFTRGAAAVLVINDPLTRPPGSERDVLVPYAASGVSGLTASIPAALLTASAGAKVLESLGYDLMTLQQRIDQRMAPRSFRFPSADASVIVDAAQEQVQTANVVGILPGADGRVDGEYVLVGAHMDHLGFGRGHGSLGGDEAVGQIHNGADDNASGTAGLIGIAEMLGARDGGLRRPVVFVAFSGEEWGLLGARHYVDHPVLPLDDLVAMLNMDMIGRSVDGSVDVGGAGSGEGLAALVDELAASVGGLKPTTSDGARGSSDHAPFLERNIPALFFFTGLHGDYHKPSDDAHLVNAEHGARIATLTGEVAAALSVLDGRPAFRAPPAAGPHGVADPAAAADPHAADPHAAATDPHAAPADGAQPVVVGYGVRLGTTPDMGYQGTDGVRVAAVAADSAAAKAGMQAGDRITALDGTSIASLEDYSILLFSHKPGDTIVLTVVRGTETLDLTAVLEGRRADG